MDAETRCDSVSGGSMTVLPPSTKYVWCWERLDSEAHGSTENAENTGVRRSRKITGPSEGNANHQHICPVCQSPSSYHEDDLMKENPFCLQCISRAVLGQLEILPIGELIEWFTTYVTWIESGKGEEDMIKEDFKRNVLFHFTVWSEGLLSDGFSRARVKNLYRLMAGIAEDDLLSAHIKQVLSDYAIKFRLPKSVRVSIILEVVRERLDDILDSAQELHRIYESYAVPGQDNEWFYHYSSSAAAIWSSGEFRPSVEEGHNKFGDGVYFTEIPPSLALSTELRNNNYDGSTQGLERVCVCIKIPKKSVEKHIKNCIDPKRPYRNIWIIPTKETFSLPSGSRIEFHAEGMIPRLENSLRENNTLGLNYDDMLTSIKKSHRLEKLSRGGFSGIATSMLHAITFICGIGLFISTGVFLVSSSKSLEIGSTSCFYAQMSKESMESYAKSSTKPASGLSNTWFIGDSGVIPLSLSNRIKFYDNGDPDVHKILNPGGEFIQLVALAPAHASLLPKPHTEGKCIFQDLRADRPPAHTTHWCFYTQIPKESIGKYAKPQYIGLQQFDTWYLGSDGASPLPPDITVIFYDYVDPHIHYSDDILDHEEELFWLLSFDRSLLPTVHTEGKCTIQHMPIKFPWLSSIVGLFSIFLLKRVCAYCADILKDSIRTGIVKLIYLTLLVSDA